MKKPSVEIEEELEKLSLENEPKKRIPTLAEAKSAYEIIYDRLSHSKGFDEEGLEILLKVANLLNKKILMIISEKIIFIIIIIMF